jgi:uncharacterized repeat protein (TIGR01451 family)
VAVTLGALLAAAAICGSAWAAGLATTEWPMFHRDTDHTGSAYLPGPPLPETRWWQGGAAISPYEDGHVPHGPQGAIFSSAASSEFRESVPGAKKIWYFHHNSWTDRTPLMLRSELPDEAAAGVAISAAPTEVVFETSAAMQFAGATPPTLDTLIYRNRDPNSNLVWVKQADNTYRYQMRIPAGLWTFDFWVTNVPAATNINFTVYRFAHATPDTRTAIAGLDPVKIPIPQTADGPLRRIQFAQRVDNDALLDPNDGIAIGVSVDAGSASLVVEGEARSRVVTPIQVRAIYAGADDGSVWAFDAATGNVLWGYAVPGAFFRSSPAVGDDGSIYIGSMEGTGHDQGRLYAFNLDGTLKWTYPALNQFAFFRSGYLTPDNPAAFPPDTAPLYPFPGSGTDPNPDTVAQTGASAGGFFQFIPRTTNSASLSSPPGDLTQAGWLFQINSQAQSRALAAGTWVLDLALRAAAGNTQTTSGFINYRISKVRVVAGTPPTVELIEELLGWTQDTQRLELPAGQRVFAHIETPTVSEASFAAGDFIFVELLIRQAVSTGASGGGWELLLEGKDSFGGSDSRLTVPGLSQAPLNAISSSPVISGDDVVYIATHGGEVHAVEAVDGEQRWVQTLREGDIADELRSSPAFSSSGKLYIGSMNGRLYALDGNDGGIIWRFPVSGQAALGPIESSPALDEGREQIYFGSDDGNVYAVKPVQVGNQITPQLQWSFATGGAVISTPAIAPDGTIYFGSLDRSLYALHPDGTSVGGLWPYAAAGEIQSSPALAVPGTFFFVNEQVTDAPARTPTPLHFAALRTGSHGGREISRVLSNPDPFEATLDQKFDQEFRTHPQASESSMASVMPRGTYTMHFWGRATAAQAFLYFKVFHCTSSDPTGTQILLFPAQQVPQSSRPSEFQVQAQLAQDEAFAATDYLRVEVWGRAVLPASSSGTVFFSFDGSLVSHMEGPSLIYFATSALRLSGLPPQVIPQGRVYCLDQTGRVVWVDPNDGLPGFNPRGATPLSALTAFTASPAVWEAESTRITAESGGSVTGVARRLDPVVYLGGHDGVMYAFGPAGEFPPPAELPPPAAAPSVLTITKQADKEVADIGQQITYTLRYRNESPILALPATNVVIEDPLPAGVDFVAASDGGQDLGGIITWTAAGTPQLAEVWPQDTGQVSFTVTVNDTVNVVPPLGEEEPPVEPPLQPGIYVSNTDPVTQGVTPPDDIVDFQWGDMLYVFLSGRGKPGEVINSPTDPPEMRARVYSADDPVIVGYAQPLTVYAGWGKRYRLTFSYSPANDPDPAALPDNQPIIYTTEYILSATDTRTGRPEEAYEYEDAVGFPDPRPQYLGEALGLTVFKVQLAPRGYAYSPNAVSVTEPPNRPWTPYYWRLTVQQNRGGAAGREDWGPPWEPNTDPGGARTQAYDFMIHDPLEVTPASFALAGAATINPGTQTQSTSFTIYNISKHSLTGTGPVYPRSVIRWDKVDLAQSGPVFSNPGYEFRDENYLPQDRIQMGRGQVRLGPGQHDSTSVWGDIPKYLSPGDYRAPSLNPSAPGSEMLIYVDLNGNLTWDPGETKFENEYDYDVNGNLVAGDFGPFEMTATLSLQPWVRFGSETVDAAKAPPGAVAKPPTPALVNLGNVDLAAVTLDPNYIDPDTGLPSPLLPLERADLGKLSLYDWRETRPLGWDLSAISAAVAKTPVGAVRPNQEWLVLHEPGDPEGFTIPHDQPCGTYSRPPDAVSAVSGVVTRDASPLKVRVVERRLTGYDGSGQAVLGADVAPWATWVDEDTLRIFWSSNRRADGTAPAASDPYMLWYDTLNRASNSWAGAASYPAVGGDPMDTPAGAVSKSHMTPGHGIDADGTEWLFWGGSDLRPNGTGGHFYDNRLLWTSGWPLPTSADAIEDDPDVSGPTGNPANMSDVFRVQPRPVFWDDGSNEFNYVVLSEQSASQAWGLRVRYRSRALGGGWGAWTGPVTLYSSSGLTAARDPSAFEFDGYLWVVFSGASAYHRNYDIYCARYDPATLGQVAFGGVTGEALTPDAARTIFVSRHKEWVVTGRADVQIYVGGTEIGGALGAYDPATGRYPITGGTYDVTFSPSLGTVYFSVVPTAAVTADYTPKLLRLTTHPADESNPAAFMETYRYLDAGGNPQPAGYVPRLWVFWTQEGLITQGAEITYLSAHWDAATSTLTEERAPRVVPVDHVANEFGLCAVKDPRYAQVWLLWSSTRAAPSGGAEGAAADSDIYYQVFDPELP